MNGPIGEIIGATDMCAGTGAQLMITANANAVSTR